MALSYNQIIQASRAFQQAHFQLENFGNGAPFDIALHNQTATYKYPLMWMQDLSMPFEPKVEVFAFRVYFLAPVVTLKDRETDLMSTNINEVKSDMMKAAGDFLAYWAQDSVYDTLNVDKNAVRETIYDTIEDAVTGCYIDIRFRQAFNYNSCAIPMSGVTPPASTCAPVFIYEDLILVDTVASGGAYYYVSGGGGSIDIEINAQPFITGQSTNIDIPVLNTNNDQVGVENPLGVWKIGNSEIQINNSIGGGLYTIPIVAEGVAVQAIADCTTTVNGVSITNNKAQTSKAITIRYANNDPVVVTEITDTEGVFVGEVPDVVIPLNVSTPFKTGQTVSYVANDDGALERGNGVDFTTLSHNNYFGNTNRFTDILGGQTYADNWIIDWSTYNQVTGAFLMWYRVYEAAATWTNAMAAQPYTRGAYADCYLPNEAELYNLLNRGVTPSTNYAPLNINVTAANQGLWMSTTIPSNTLAAYYFAGSAINNTINASAKTANQRFILMRYGNISEL